jgi:peroxiredoxin
MLRPGAVVLFACMLAACTQAAAPRPRSAPTWERPGLGGAVRPEMGSPQPGEAAPDLALPDLEGHEVSLASMRGSWVVLHFTATWCPFCDSEVSHLGQLAEAFGARGVRTVIVDVEETAAAWHAYAKEHVSPSLVALQDTTGAVAARFAPPRAQPSFDDRAQAVLDATLIIDPKGTIRLFLLPDSAHFDPTFRAVRAELDRLVPQAVVAVSAQGAEIAAGTSAEVAVTVRVADGYHVMSDRPSAPNYIPTRIAVPSGDGIEIADARYPKASAFALGERTISTFAGEVLVKIPIHVAADATPGPRRLHGTMRYQACTASRCLFPTNQVFELPLTVRAPAI